MLNRHLCLFSSAIKFLLVSKKILRDLCFFDTILVHGDLQDFSKRRTFCACMANRQQISPHTLKLFNTVKFKQ